MSTVITRPRFTAADAERASETWGANCGPGAIAAMLGMTLDELRPHLGDFEAKGYTNPTLMFETLNRLGVTWRQVRGAKQWPSRGLVRVQWEGPWTQPGVPMRARYRYTHWVGAVTRAPGDIGIFDINAMSNGSGWVSLQDWSDTLVPWLLSEAVPRANGRWHLASVIEVEHERN
jgi:hypothetical protein